MDDSDVQHALLHKVIDLSLSLVEGVIYLRNILEPRLEYWIEFVEPFLREMERYRQKYGRQDVEDERRQVQEELDRMECQDERQQMERQQQHHQSMTTTHHSYSGSCRRRLEYDDDDMMQHDNVSS